MQCIVVPEGAGARDVWPGNGLIYIDTVSGRGGMRWSGVLGEVKPISAIQPRFVERRGISTYTDSSCRIEG